MIKEYLLTKPCVHSVLSPRRLCWRAKGWELKGFLHHSQVDGSIYPVRVPSPDAEYHHKHSWIFSCRFGKKEQKDSNGISHSTRFFYKLYRNKAIYQAFMVPGVEGIIIAAIISSVLTTTQILWEACLVKYCTCLFTIILQGRHYHAPFTEVEIEAASN